MKSKVLYKKIRNIFGQKEEKQKQDLYVKILLWAHGRQEIGFTWDEMKKVFNLNPLQEAWVRKIFLTISDNDRKLFEHLRNDETVTPNLHYYSLNEKGMIAAINYKGLEHAEKTGSRAIWFAGLSVLLTVVGLFFIIKQTNLTESQSIGDRIEQGIMRQRAEEFCNQNPTAEESGLYYENGKPAPCSVVLEKSLLRRIMFWMD